jgi:hypothetical protein
VSSARFFSVLEDSKGPLVVRLDWLKVFIITMGNPFNISQPRRDLLIMRLFDIYEDKVGTIWFGTLMAEQAVTMGSHFEIM